MSKEKPLAIGVDVGGTKIQVAAVDSEGRILARNVFQTDPEKGHVFIIKNIVTSIKTLQKEIGSTINAIGLGIAGQIMPENGVVKFAPNLKWKEVPLQRLIQDELNIPAVVLNDVRAGTWGEWKHGAGKGMQELVCVFVGTGIGGGLVTGGKLVTGFTNAAGELGHVVVEINGPECTCGNRGCLEALSSGWAIAKRVHGELEGETSVGKTILDLAQNKRELVSARHVIEAAAKKDLLSQEIVNDAIEALVAGCIGFVNMYNPQRLIIGGGLGLALPDLIRKIEEGVRHYALKAASEKVEIVPAALKNEAGVVGAATYSLSWNKIFF